MIEYTRLALTRYAQFSGRSRRSEYWWFTLANVLLQALCIIVDVVVGTPLTLIVSIALFVPGMAVTVRRLHDTNRSGWWILIAFVPLVGAILLIVWLATEGERQPNLYGPDPKAVGGGYGGGYQAPPGQSWGQSPVEQGWGQPPADQGQWGQQPPAQPQWGQPPQGPDLGKH